LQAEFLEDGLDIPKALARLTGDVRRSPFARLSAWKERSLPRDEHETVGDHAVRIWADRLRMVRQFGDSSHVSTAAGLAGVSKALCAALDQSNPQRAISPNGSTDRMIFGRMIVTLL
jgi:hypothetical protein